MLKIKNKALETMENNQLSFFKTDNVITNLKTTLSFLSYQADDEKSEFVRDLNNSYDRLREVQKNIKKEKGNHVVKEYLNSETILMANDEYEKNLFKTLLSNEKSGMIMVKTYELLITRASKDTYAVSFYEYNVLDADNFNKENATKLFESIDPIKKGKKGLEIDLGNLDIDKIGENGKRIKVIDDKKLFPIILDLETNINKEKMNLKVNEISEKMKNNLLIEMDRAKKVVTNQLLHVFGVVEEEQKEIRNHLKAQKELNKEKGMKTKSDIKTSKKVKKEIEVAKTNAINTIK